MTYNPKYKVGQVVSFKIGERIFHGKIHTIVSYQSDNSIRYQYHVEECTYISEDVILQVFTPLDNL